MEIFDDNFSDSDNETMMPLGRSNSNHSLIQIDRDSENTSGSAASKLIRASSVPIVSIPQRQSAQLPCVVLPSGLVYDSRLLSHEPLAAHDLDHPESPDRLRCIYEALKRESLLYLFKRITSIPISLDDLKMVHAVGYIKEIEAIQGNRHSIESFFLPL
jgi:hypothetical protein